MNQPLTLIQLVSEQTLPNILPALALRPSRLILCHTTRTVAQTQWIRHALELAGLKFDLQLRSLGLTPDAQETGGAVRALIQECHSQNVEALINFTGGTKLMSLGAFVAALNEKVASCYIDSENMRFVDGGTAPLPFSLLDSYQAMSRAEASLNLDIVAAAHGIRQLRSGREPAAFLPLALHLLKNPEEELAGHELLKKTNPKTPAEALTLLNAPVVGMSPDVVRLAAEAGLLTSRSGAWYFNRPSSLDRLEAWAAGEHLTSEQWFAALGPLQQAVAFFCGGWWEVAVLETARRSGAFRDLRWSVEIVMGNQTFEKDILALDGVNLAVFSCKRGGRDSARCVAAIDELDANARQIGGSHARKFFCVAQAVPRKFFAAVQARASQTRTNLVGPYDRLTPDQFILR